MISVKISSFISNIIYLLLDVLTQQWCLHQEFFKHYRNWHNFSNCHYKNATNRTCTGNLRNWCYDFSFFWTIFRMLGLNSFQHWLISIPFSRFIICVGSIALMIRASLIFLFFQSSSFSRYTTSCHLMEWVLCASKCTKKAFVFFPFFTSFWCWYFLLSIFALTHQCTIFYSLHNQIYRLCSFAASLGSFASGDKLPFWLCLLFWGPFLHWIFAIFSANFPWNLGCMGHVCRVS